MLEVRIKRKREEPSLPGFVLGGAKRPSLARHDASLRCTHARAFPSVDAKPVTRSVSVVRAPPPARAPSSGGGGAVGGDGE